MKQTSIAQGEMKLVGIQVRTSFTAESNPETGLISPCVQRYFHQQLFDKIPGRKKPGTTICAYTAYSSNYQGDYTYFIGEEVASTEAVPEGFETLVVPPQTYAKFTTEPAPVPDVIIGAWQQIWKMTPEQFGGKREYLTDFEVYDERAQDHSSAVLDLYIGIKS